jgi:hypothetical protein
VNEAGEVLLPLYEGRMIGQFDFSAKGCQGDPNSVIVIIVVVVVVVPCHTAGARRGFSISIP